MNAKIFGGILAILALFLAVGYGNAGDEASWSKERAGKYLDEREQIWFESFPPAERGEGEGKTSCVSCHSVAPYALARPVLRKIMGDKEATKYEQQILLRTRKRVENWKELDTPQFQLLYEFNEAKKKESWGTEAVLNAFILAFDDFYQERKETSPTTRMAFRNLWKSQSTEGVQSGSWDWLDFSLQPWESKDGRYFGAVLAALAVGTAPGYYAKGTDPDLDQRVDLLRTYLRSNLGKQNLFNRLWLLWAATRMEGLLDTAERKQIIAAIQSQQQPDGGWRLASLGKFERNDATPQEASSDGYATGLVLHILQTAGLPKEDPTVRRGLSWLRGNQKASGAWAGSSVNKKRDPESSQPAKAHVGKFMWDAATAYAVLALSHAE
jgi:squalene-hopene/tetraprenyl-beta-curcumene cyclase